MSEVNNIINLIDSLTVARDSYKRMYDTHNNSYKKALDGIKNDFKPNTERYKEEVAKADLTFKNDVQKAKKEVMDFIIPQIEDLRNYELSKVRVIDTDALEKINAISNIPISSTELLVLQKRFSGNVSNYWADRMLINIAEKNGIKPSIFFKEADIDTKINVLNQLEEQLDKMFNEYNGEATYNNLVLLCDSVLHKAEKEYTSGHAAESMENNQLAKRILTQLKGKSTAEQGIALQNLMKNATPEVKKALFYEMTMNEGVVNKDSIKFAGITDTYNDYKTKEHALYSEARTMIENSLKAKSLEEVKEIAERMEENPYYSNMLKKSETANVYVNDYLSNINAAETTTA